MKTIIENFKKYHLDFWMSVVGKVALIAIAIVNGFIYSPSYFSLIVPYAIVLIIRVPSFFINKKINKDNKDNVEVCFTKKHYISLYTSGILFFWLIITYPLDLLIPNGFLKAQPLLMMYIVFVPWGVIRFSFEIFRIIKYRKSGDPYFRAKALVNIYCAIAVVTKLFVDLYYLHSDVMAFMVIAVALAFITLGYVVTIAIYLLVVAIRGLNGKRDKAYKRFIDEQN